MTQCMCSTARRSVCTSSGSSYKRPQRCSSAHSMMCMQSYLAKFILRRNSSYRGCYRRSLASAVDTLHHAQLSALFGFEGPALIVIEK